LQQLIEANGRKNLIKRRDIFDVNREINVVAK
jgi:hypothetical protein